MRSLKVAIIGGGCGGITTAYELSRPEHRGRFEVTVYQQGWRLGGKGASGRGPCGRIEEHGLHIWLGFYDNAFRMMRDCYAELDGAFGDVFDAFVADHDVGLFARHEGGGWQRWACRFPARPGLPGDPDPTGGPQSLGGYLAGAIDMLRAMLIDLDVSRDAHEVPPPSPPNIVRAVQALGGRGVFGGTVIMVQALAMIRTALGAFPSIAETPLASLVDGVSAAVRRWLEDELIADDRHRHLWELIDLVLAATMGSIRHGLLTDPRGLDAIDDHDCREWLRRNGASERSLDSPFIRGLYDLMFAYRGGDHRQPAVAAGSSLRGWLRMFFGYRGAIFWRLRAGMGDGMFAPLHALLERRGVRFEFFHRLTDIGVASEPDRDGAPSMHIASLDFDVQATTKDCKPYQPLITVRGRQCWPAEPDFDQLRGGQRLRADGIDFESHWNRQRIATRRLEVGTDFDFAVLAVGLGAVPQVAGQLLAHSERWRTMTERVGTVATQAFQLWLNEDLGALGWQAPPYIVSAGPRPFETWSDMAHVVPEENWPVPPATAVYFCSALADPERPADTASPDYPARRKAEVRANALSHLSASMRSMWPMAYDGGGFRWSLLATPPDAVSPATTARFDTQYWRANVNPSDYYVQSLPGTNAYRLSPLDRSFDNFTIAGDWTCSGLNTGCAEAAVMSGRLAAHALSGFPALKDITGYDHP